MKIFSTGADFISKLLQQADNFFLNQFIAQFRGNLSLRAQVELIKKIFKVIALT